MSGITLMRAFSTLLAGGLAIALFAPLPASAMDGAAPGKELVFDLGVGGRLQPKYPGAESYALSPFPIFQLQYLVFPGLGTVADASTQGIFFRPAFGFVGERSARDDADLTGTNKVDWALEFGAGLGYRTDSFRAFAEARRGFGGHQGFVGELGVDAILHPMERVSLRVGPRLGLADAEYMATYFGVTAAESAASGGALAAFSPGGGLTDVGVDARLSYDWTENAAVHLDAGYRRLVGDAAKSPITKAGSADQFTVGLGVSYRFAFDLDGE